MRRLSIFLRLVLAALSALALTPAHAHKPDGEAFVATFAEVCIPERLSYQGTLALAERLGWNKIVPGEDALTDHFIANAREQIEKAKQEDADFAFEAEMEIFSRTIEGRRYILAVDLALTDHIDLVGCLLYDFAATEPIDAEPVSRLLNRPIAYTTLGGDPDYAVDPAQLVSTVWGPSPGFPRTLDTYLTFIPEGSPVAAQTGFAGLVLKFSTSLPDRKKDETARPVLAEPIPADTEWNCDDAIYASETCPWFGQADDGAAPTVWMRWSADGYPPGSAAGRWNDGIFVIVDFPNTEPPGTATLSLDIGYEPHRQPREARDLEPVAVILRLGEKQWRNDAPQPLPHPRNNRPQPEIFFEGSSFYRFAFDADVVDAMLAASDAGPTSYSALFFSNDPPGVLHFEILFREREGGIVSSNDLLEVASGQCETNCLPRLSLAGFSKAFLGSEADGEE